MLPGGSNPDRLLFQAVTKDMDSQRALYSASMLAIESATTVSVPFIACASFFLEGHYSIAISVTNLHIVMNSESAY